MKEQAPLIILGLWALQETWVTSHVCMQTQKFLAIMVKSNCGQHCIPYSELLGTSLQA